MKNYLKTTLTLLITILVVIWLYYAFSHKPTASDASVLLRLGSIMLLNENTAPSMAVITDINAAKQLSPTLFANAEDGDRVIIYPDITIIYDYAKNQIINIQKIPVSNPVILNASGTNSK